MSSFIQTDLRYHDDRLALDGVDLAGLADRFGTPLYVYSVASIKKAVASFREGLAGRDHLLCYAVKANSNLHILEVLRDQACGADIVSAGELARARRAGIPAERIVFSGVGKTEQEIETALAGDILLFVVESAAELETLARLATRAGKIARISIRVNPDIDAGTHPYIATGMRDHKFGIDHREVLALYRRALELPGLDPAAIGFHIGSQLTALQPYRDAASRINELIVQVRAAGLPLRYLDVGGGLGIPYRKTGDQVDSLPAPAEYTRMLGELLPRDLTLILEPGRSIVGEAGVLLTRIIRRKQTSSRLFFICDAGMNDLLRPSLYNAYHEIMPLRAGTANVRADLVGPVCESGDFFAKDRIMADFQAGDLGLLASAGAYSFCMASNYNSRGRAAEVLVEADGSARLIRRRETDADMLRLEEGL